ncbi:hypothetical protein CALVIDRAFT_307690 [Calocera viscosa TUFC12733]|uniref:Uncharacterized protein n=1 Tax=Calocera viscosa (strain TUFC12733) TaxID=1330018 RepID=A0A167ICP1_CALVF|nr:hypothetical protein CALVIDRAFT_307690 [Calocera viscosa TUFC12733]
MIEGGMASARRCRLDPWTRCCSAKIEDVRTRSVLHYPPGICCECGIATPTMSGVWQDGIASQRQVVPVQDWRFIIKSRSIVRGSISRCAKANMSPRLRESVAVLLLSLSCRQAKFGERRRHSLERTTLVHYTLPLLHCSESERDMEKMNPSRIVQLHPKRASHVRSHALERGRVLTAGRCPAATSWVIGRETIIHGTSRRSYITCY